MVSKKKSKNLGTKYTSSDEACSTPPPDDDSCGDDEIMPQVPRQLERVTPPPEHESAAATGFSVFSVPIGGSEALTPPTTKENQ